jgi:putative redox protein
MSKEISVRLGSINYACTVSDGRHEWIIDEPVDKGGNDIAHDPYSALLASIGSCSAITMKMYAQRKGWPVEDIEVKMSLAIQTVAGKRKSVFTRNIFVKGNLSREQLTRLEQIATVCPVSKILEGDILVETGLTQIPDPYPVNLNDTKKST